HTEDRVARAVDAADRIAIELDLLANRARDALHDVAFDRVAQTLRIDDQAAIVRDHHATRPDPPRIALDLDLGHGGHRSAVALGEGDAAPFQQFAAALALRRSSRLPLRLLRRRLDDGGMARLGEVPQAERDRILAHGSGQLVDELLAAEVDLGPDRIAHMRGAQGRAVLNQR